MTTVTLNGSQYSDDGSAILMLRKTGSFPTTDTNRHERT